MSDDYLSKHPHVAEAAKRVASMLGELGQVAPFYPRSDDVSVAVEIEGRLGRAGAPFDPNIGAEAFCAIVGMLETFESWQSVSDWEETQDVFYTTNLAPDVAGDGGGPVQVRTTVSGFTSLSLTHTVKKKIRHVDLALQSVDVGACALETEAPGQVQCPLSARVACSTEREIPASALPVAVRPDLVRIKQRKKFLLRSGFSFEVTIVYQGRTKTEAERKQKASEGASYEVECECVSPSEYLAQCGGDLICLALSLVVKLLDFAAALNPDTCVTFVPHVADGDRASRLRRRLS